MTKTTDIASLTPEAAKAEIANLTAQVVIHDRAYHRDDAPTIPDAEYDALRQRLVALEAAFPELASPNSPTRLVGAAPSEGFG